MQLGANCAVEYSDHGHSLLPGVVGVNGEHLHQRNCFVEFVLGHTCSISGKKVVYEGRGKPAIKLSWVWFGLEPGHARHQASELACKQIDFALDDGRTAERLDGGCGQRRVGF